MKNVFQKDRPNELKESYCNSIFESYGSFHPVINPAILSMKGETEYIQVNQKCFFCDVMTTCSLYVPTHRIHRFFSICTPCMQDFNMFIFNKHNLDYCRTIKQLRVPYAKKHLSNGLKKYLKILLNYIIGLNVSMLGKNSQLVV